MNEGTSKYTRLRRVGTEPDDGLSYIEVQETKEEAEQNEDLHNKLEENHQKQE